MTNGREPLSLSEAFEGEDGRLKAGWRWIVAYRGAGLYAAQVGRYIDTFGPGQVKVYLLDDLRKDAASVMADMYDFLGVDRSFKPVIEIYNRSAQMRLKWADRLLRSKAVLWLARLLPTVLRHRVRDLLLKDEMHEKLSPEDRTRYYTPFADDIARLASLIDRDLSAWKP